MAALASETQNRDKKSVYRTGALGFASRRIAYELVSCEQSQQSSLEHHVLGRTRPLLTTILSVDVLLMGNQWLWALTGSLWPQAEG
jgi:hypothetical protein